MERHVRCMIPDCATREAQQNRTVTSMLRAGTAACRCTREGLAPVKPGKISWVHGTKLPFFQAHREAYLEAAELRETGEF
jgi:hypothetical protein